MPKYDAKEWTKRDCLQCLAWREGDCNKGDFGYIALVGGSLKYSGAAKLANIAAAAMRSGAGVVKLAVPKTIANAVAPYLCESTLFPLSDADGEILFDEKEISLLTANVNAVGIGMGCGTGNGVKETVRFLLREFDGNLVVDADGLNCIAQTGAQVLDGCKPRVVLTPHVKEFSRLTGKTVKEITDDPQTAAKEIAARHGVTLLLKGAVTVVTDGKETYTVKRGCAGMATAGSGDVLSGIVTALLGYNPDKALQATATAAYVNGFAGELAQKNLNPISMIASDTAMQIARAITLLTKTDDV